MTIATIVTGDSPGNAAVTPSVVQKNVAANMQIFAVTANGIGQVMAIVDILGSPDGVNFTPQGQMTVQGQAPVTMRHRIASSLPYWTMSPVLCSPGTTIDGTIQY